MFGYDAEWHYQQSQLLDADQWVQHLKKQFTGKKVAVWGAARSGMAAAYLMAHLDADVHVYDARDDVDTFTPHPNIHVHLASDLKHESADVVIPSPGIPPRHPALRHAQAEDVAIVSEIELGAWCTQAQLIGITGTDGKSTCTSLMNHILNHLEYTAHAVGNIGDPLCNWSLQVGKQDYLVVEVSAFQLWSTHYFPARVALLTNIAQDHYDYFDHDAVAYREAKLQLAHLLPAHSHFIWSDTLQDDWMKQCVHTLHNRSVYTHSFGESVQSDYYVDETGYYGVNGYTLATHPVSQLIGRHHQRNVLSILASLEALQLDIALALPAIMSFKSLPHRMSLVRTRNGVTWVNDSKATNAHASLAGLQSVDHPLYVICGGYDKSLDLSTWLQWLYTHAQKIYCIGDLTKALVQQLQHLNRMQSHVDQHTADYVACYTLECAVEYASQQASTGSLVILSPASSSFDQFKSFEHRGEVFEQLVHALPNEASEILGKSDIIDISTIVESSDT